MRILSKHTCVCVSVSLCACVPVCLCLCTHHLCIACVSTNACTCLRTKAHVCLCVWVSGCRCVCVSVCQYVSVCDSKHQTIHGRRRSPRDLVHGVDIRAIPDHVFIILEFPQQFCHRMTPLSVQQHRKDSALNPSTADPQAWRSRRAPSLAPLCVAAHLRTRVAPAPQRCQAASPAHSEGRDAPAHTAP